MGVGVKVRVWGNYALFSRPEMKVERCSYDVMTPSAARGILEAVYWHPGMRWVIDKIHVVNPVRFTSVRRNEVKSKILAGNVLQAYNGKKDPRSLYISTKAEIVQRASLLLRDVEYVIEAHFEMTEEANETDNPGKFKDIIMRIMISFQIQKVYFRSASDKTIEKVLIFLVRTVRIKYIPAKHDNGNLILLCIHNETFQCIAQFRFSLIRNIPVKS